jgi:hypothetical protein
MLTHECYFDASFLQTPSLASEAVLAVVDIMDNANELMNALCPPPSELA